MKYYLYVKTILDTLLALILLVMLSPVITLSAILIKLEDPSGPIFFRQKRIGKNRKVFSVFKLRSMKVTTEENGVALSDTDRMLKYGGLFRKLSLDELPQFINIIKGDMSFIGPRPLPVIYGPYFNEIEDKRHNVKPGISGWAQVNGRNNLGWEEKFKLDVEYVNNVSFLFDFKIVLMTIWKVLRKSDVVVRGENEVMDFHTYRIKQLNNIKEQNNG